MAPGRHGKVLDLIGQSTPSVAKPDLLGRGLGGGPERPADATVDFKAMRPSERPLILLAGDDAFLGLLKYVIEQEGFDTLVANDDDRVYSLANTHKPDLITLVSSRALGPALEMYKRICDDSRTSHVPILMLMSDTDAAKNLKLQSTATRDFILKPFAPGEIIRRIKALLQAQLSAAGDVISFRDITMNLRSHRVYRGSRKIHLGPVEYRLLHHFLNNPGQVFSRKQLLELVWGRDIHVVLRTVDVHVGRLRRRLNMGGETNYLRTVRAAGYSLDPEE